MAEDDDDEEEWSGSDEDQQGFRKRRRTDQQQKSYRPATSSSSSSEDSDDDGSDIDEAKFDQVKDMMIQLKSEAENGKFRSLPFKYAKQAMACHEKNAEGRVRGVNAAFDLGMNAVNVRVGTTTGQILSVGCTKKVTDVHGCYVQFSMKQLHPDAKKKLRRQIPSGFSSEYSMTRFKFDDAIDVYYSGNDPFVVATTTTKLDEDDDAEKKEIPKFSVIANPEAAKKFLTCDDEIAVGIKPLIPDDIAKQRYLTPRTSRQTTLTSTFLSAKTPIERKRRHSDSTSAAVVVTKEKTKPKHSKFDRNMFYVNALDVYCVA